MAEETKQKSPEEKYEARKHLLQLLLIALVVVAIIYLGFNIATGIIAFVLFFIGIR
jgi:cell division septal protein FtsQ